MKLIHGFIFTEQFFDDAHFPHGFRKSGDFSIAEAELLTSIGKRLFSLEQGISSPENQVEEQFVQMSKTQREAQTKVELLWKKYNGLTKHKKFHCLNGQA